MLFLEVLSPQWKKLTGLCSIVVGGSCSIPFVSSHWLQCFTFSGLKEIEDGFKVQELERSFAKKDCDIRACINSWKHLRKLMRIGLSAISGRYSTKCLALDFSSLTSKARSVSSCFVNL